MKDSLVQQCLDVLKREDIKNELKILVNPILEFIFGEKMEFSNRITFTVEAQHSIVEGHKIPFNSNMLREIFHNNKGASSTSIKFTQEGLLKLEFDFKEENTKTTYFVVRKADY